MPNMSSISRLDQHLLSFEPGCTCPHLLHGGWVGVSFLMPVASAQQSRSAGRAMADLQQASEDYDRYQIQYHRTGSPRSKSINLTSEYDGAHGKARAPQSTAMERASGKRRVANGTRVIDLCMDQVNGVGQIPWPFPCPCPNPSRCRCPK